TLIVLGTGVAGSSAALKAAEEGVDVTIISAGEKITDCNSYWAQGGIIYRNPSDPNDSVASLSNDIKVAGVHLNDPSAVLKLATEGPSKVEEFLLQSGPGPYANVPFDRDEDGELKFCLEASHSATRIIHWQDWTGKAITDSITSAALRHPKITFLQSTVVINLLLNPSRTTCLGVQYLTPSNALKSLTSTQGVVLASGGLGGIYQHSTNPSGFNALGSSVSLASRASAITSDLEYVQFHPTALHIPNEPRFLLSEALRGEGAILRDKDGRPFAKDFHPSGELAPRDVVARAVYETTNATGGAYLDITHRGGEWATRRFPSISKYLKERGMDIGSDWMPTVPAAHYTCGGVETDLSGRTSVGNLYAAGEAARTGLHGGNRLASTSLLEGLVWGSTVGEVASGAERVVEEEGREWEGNTEGDRVGAGRDSERLMERIRKTMWEKVGIVRTEGGMASGVSEMEGMLTEAEALFEGLACRETAMVRDAATAGLEVAKAAVKNKESKGTHCVVKEEEAVGAAAV
ncbi:hypothetical protein TrRE_jg5364, partial [Triparma retinervis]